MKKLLSLLLVLMLGILPALSQAEIFINVEKPADWAERETLQVICFQTLQNSCMLITCGGETMMLDSGTEIWAPKLLRVFQKWGLTDFKYMYNTHPHDDHLGGMCSLMNAKDLTIGAFVTGFDRAYTDEKGLQQKALRHASRRNIPVIFVNPGDKLTLGSAEMTFYRYEEGNTTNDLSLLTRFTFGGSSILFTGDVTGTAQHPLAQKYAGGELVSDIMQVPHHGYTLTPDFLEAMKPSFIFSNGGKKHQPYPEGQAKMAGIGHMYTDDGAIVMETDGTDWYINQTWKKFTPAAR